MPGKYIGTLALCSALLAAMPALAGIPDGCAGLRDGISPEEAFVSVEKFPEGAGCFRVPLVVTASPAVYAASKADLLVFDPVELLGYISGRQSVMVGAEERIVERDKLGCLENPTPRQIIIMSRYKHAPVTVREMTAYSDETPTDMPGYVRYFDMVGDYYVADTRPEAQVSFFCRRVPELTRDVCQIEGDYDEMTAVITYHKSQMADIRPEQALQCIRAIADLFRVTKPQ
jgi:hypothetical protein